MYKRIYLAIILCIGMIAGAKAQIKTTLTGCRETPALAFARNELKIYLDRAMQQEGIRKEYIFKLVCDKNYRNGAFGCKAVTPTRFELRGGDPTSISHAIYTFLEELGYTFDISGTLSPEHFAFDRMNKINVKITPKVRWRGIRQHVNFPMDVSSYSLDEAKEYLNNLIRLRFNKLVVHSYPGIWYEQSQGDSLLRAGNFFYDSPHYYKDNECLKAHVRENDSLFCIPTMEQIYFNQPEKSRRTMEWMREWLTHAKEIGLYVQFSFEPRKASLEQTIAIAHNIRETYPMIDALELMTEETGGWGDACTRMEVENTIRRYWGEEMLKDSIVTSPIRDKQSDLNYLYGQIGNNSQAVVRLKQEKDFTSTEVKLGIYCTTDYARPAYYLAKKVLPATLITLMPSHGSDGVAKAMEKVLDKGENLSKTEIYSWIEFDGLMYQQQNGIGGIHHLLDNLSHRTEQIPSVCFNHWRTCENRVTARYASEGTLSSPLSPNVFYPRYAGRLGISSPTLFTDVMKEINRIDSFSTTSLGNIGFCWTGAWRNAGLFRWMNTDHIDSAITDFEKTDRMLLELLKETQPKASQDLLELLENRIACSIIYLKGFRKATAIREIKESNLSTEEKEKVIEICNNALSVFDQYIEHYAKLLPDRGSEGVIVSVWNSPIYGLKLIRQKMASVPLKQTCHNENSIDSPPLPIYYQ